MMGRTQKNNIIQGIYSPSYTREDSAYLNKPVIPAYSTFLIFCPSPNIPKLFSTDTNPIGNSFEAMCFIGTLIRTIKCRIGTSWFSSSYKFLSTIFTNTIERISRLTTSETESLSQSIAFPRAISARIPSFIFFATNFTLNLIFHNSILHNTKNMCKFQDIIIY